MASINPKATHMFNYDINTYMKKGKGHFCAGLEKEHNYVTLKLLRSYLSHFIIFYFLNNHQILMVRTTEHKFLIMSHQKHCKDKDYVVHIECNKITKLSKLNNHLIAPLMPLYCLVHCAMSFCLSFLSVQLYDSRRKLQDTANVTFKTYTPCVCLHHCICKV